MVKIFFFAVLVTTTSLFYSCFTTSDDGPKKHRGSLSQAMEKAEDGNDGDREVTNEEPPNTDEVESKKSRSESDTGASEDYEADDEGELAGPADLAFGIESRYAFPFQDNIKNAYAFGLEIGAAIDKSILMLRAGLEFLNLSPIGVYVKSMQDPMLSAFAGGELRVTPFSIEEPFNPYAIIGYEQGMVFWSYKNPIVSQGDTISSDSIVTYTLNLGLGTNIAKIDKFNLFVNGGFRFRLFGADTQEGFTNDYFNGESYFYLSADILMKL